MRRLEFIDIAKGIVIILMVCGHSSLPNYPEHWIFSFHMPFFFLISGVLSNWYKDSFNNFLIRKTRILMIPFFIYSFIGLLLSPLYTNYSIIEHTKIILLNGWGGIALWFVPVMFLSEILTKLIMMTINKGWKFIFFIILLVVTYLYIGNSALPWTINSVPLATTFIISGAFLKPLFDKFISLKSNFKKILICCFALCFSAFVPLVSTLDICYNKCSPFIIAYIGAFAGSTLIISISLFLNKKLGNNMGWLAIVGKNTYIILAFSQIIGIILNSYIAEYKIGKYIILIIVLIIIGFLKNRITSYYKSLLV